MPKTLAVPLRIFNPKNLKDTTTAFVPVRHKVNIIHVPAVLPEHFKTGT